MNYKIAGHTVEFPHRAYGVQLGFMDKVLRSLDSSTNALLEAPTGSGKTLSLLCSALAWQTKVKQDSYADMWEQQKAEAKPAEDLEGFRYTGGRTAADKCQSDAPESSSAEVDEEDDCGEVVLHRDKKRKKKTPKIYYATRTHSQIAQVVRELKRTKYRPKMAILASREHYCVHKTVSKKQNKDEECEKLNREEHGCKFKRNVTKLFALQNSHFLQVHDIEDLAKAGRDHKACPYYAARHYAEEAELIFCPYSYLLDPVVRAAMMVDIDGAVLTFDEAHNIEDTCREAASADLELEILSEVYAALQHVNSLGGKPEIYLPLGAAFAKLIGWLRQRADGGDLRPAGFERFEGIVAGHQAMAELKEAGLGQEEVEVLWQLYNEARAEEDKANQQSKAAGQQGGAAAEGAEQAPAAGASVGTGLRVGGLTLGVLSRLLTVLRLMYAAGSEHVRDYRLAIQKWVRHGDGNNNRGKGRNFRRNTNEDGQGEVSGWVVQFCLWSLNPAVAFHEVSEKARSVLLTSGTLAPMATFASELGVAFPTRLEAPHVVDMRRQVWAGAIGSGPDGTVLQATFKHTDTHKFQDSIGKCILQTCQVVPDGVLVFFPSYSLLDKLTTRWKATGLWGQINALKKLVSEPRGTGEAFDGVMTEYYAAIRKGKGAVFLAICRGKVSEGLDFADGNARAVMIFGIPFPNLKDTKVDLKKKYNDEGSRTKGLLSGDKWYTQQAFRALNQAIGRCIRHRCDYGAIMLIDDRFRNPRFQEHLSRWVKGALAVQPNFNDALQSVTNFFARVTADPPRPPGSAPLGAAAPTSTAAGAPLLGQVPLEPSAAATAATAAAGSGKPAKGSKKGDSKRGVAGESRLKAPGEAQSSQFVTASQPTLKNMWTKQPARTTAAKPFSAAPQAAAPAPATAAQGPTAGVPGSGIPSGQGHQMQQALPQAGLPGESVRPAMELPKPSTAPNGWFVQQAQQAAQEAVQAYHADMDSGANLGQQQSPLLAQVSESQQAAADAAAAIAATVAADAGACAMQVDEPAPDSGSPGADRASAGASSPANQAADLGSPGMLPVAAALYQHAAEGESQPAAHGSVAGSAVEPSCIHAGSVAASASAAAGSPGQRISPAPHQQQQQQWSGGARNSPAAGHQAGQQPAWSGVQREARTSPVANQPTLQPAHRPAEPQSPLDTHQAMRQQGSHAAAGNSPAGTYQAMQLQAPGSTGHHQGSWILPANQKRPLAASPAPRAASPAGQVFSLFPQQPAAHPKQPSLEPQQHSSDVLPRPFSVPQMQQQQQQHNAVDSCTSIQPPSAEQLIGQQRQHDAGWAQHQMTPGLPPQQGHAGPHLLPQQRQHGQHAWQAGPLQPGASGSSIMPKQPQQRHRQTPPQWRTPTAAGVPPLASAKTPPPHWQTPSPWGVASPQVQPQSAPAGPTNNHSSLPHVSRLAQASWPVDTPSPQVPLRVQLASQPSSAAAHALPEPQASAVTPGDWKLGGDDNMWPDDGFGFQELPRMDTVQQQPPASGAGPQQKSPCHGMEGAQQQQGAGPDATALPQQHSMTLYQQDQAAGHLQPGARPDAATPPHQQSLLLQPQGQAAGHLQAPVPTGQLQQALPQPTVQSLQHPQAPDAVDQAPERSHASLPQLQPPPTHPQHANQQQQQAGLHGESFHATGQDRMHPGSRAKQHNAAAAGITGAAAGDASTASQPAEFQPEAWPEDGGGSCSQALNFDDWQPLHQHAGVQDESAARQQQQHARAHMISEHANREATWSVGVTAASALDALIQRWAHEDWQDARLYLQQHEGLDQLTQSDGSLDDVAWRGILECFHFAKERLHDTGSLVPVLDMWQCIPRGMLAIIAAQGLLPADDDFLASSEAHPVVVQMATFPQDLAVQAMEGAYSQAAATLHPQLLEAEHPQMQQPQQDPQQTQHQHEPTQTEPAHRHAQPDMQWDAAGMAGALTPAAHAHDPDGPACAASAAEQHPQQQVAQPEPAYQHGPPKQQWPAASALAAMQHPQQQMHQPEPRRHPVQQGPADSALAAMQHPQQQMHQPEPNRRPVQQGPVDSAASAVAVMQQPEQQMDQPEPSRYPFQQGRPAKQQRSSESSPSARAGASHSLQQLVQPASKCQSGQHHVQLPTFGTCAFHTEPPRQAVDEPQPPRQPPGHDVQQLGMPWPEEASDASSEVTGQQRQPRILDQSASHHLQQAQQHWPQDPSSAVGEPTIQRPQQAMQPPQPLPHLADDRPQQPGMRWSESPSNAGPGPCPQQVVHQPPQPAVDPPQQSGIQWPGAPASSIAQQDLHQAWVQLDAEGLPEEPVLAQQAGMQRPGAPASSIAQQDLHQAWVQPAAQGLPEGPGLAQQDPQQAQRDPQHAWVDPDPAGLPEEPDFVPDSPGVPETPPDEFDAHPSSGYGVPTVAADHANGATGVAIPATGSEVAGGSHPKQAQAVCAIDVPEAAPPELAAAAHAEHAHALNAVGLQGAGTFPFAAQAADKLASSTSVSATTATPSAARYATSAHSADPALRPANGMLSGGHPTAMTAAAPVQPVHAQPRHHAASAAAAAAAQHSKPSTAQPSPASRPEQAVVAAANTASARGTGAPAAGIGQRSTTQSAQGRSSGGKRGGASKENAQAQDQQVMKKRYLRSKNAAAAEAIRNKRARAQTGSISSCKAAFYAKTLESDSEDEDDDAFQAGPG